MSMAAPALTPTLDPALAPELALGLPVLIPLLGAAAIKLLGKYPAYREAASFVTAFALLFAVLNIIPLASHSPTLILAQVLPDIPLALKLEPLGLVFALTASVLWIPTTQYAIGYMRGNREKRQTRFYMCFALSIAASIGLALSANLFSLFVFYELLTLSTYPLVTHKGDARAQRGGRIYLGTLLLTSVGFLLLAIIWTYTATGTTEFTRGGIVAGHFSLSALALLFTLYIFGIGKVALMPFHRWLPSAMVAPTPVSALLHAVAVVKAGAFSVLKISLYIFGLDSLNSGMVTDFIFWVAAFSILAASLMALRQDNLKARLAYSTISQLSYVTLGAALANGHSLLAAALQIPLHAVGKITLFFCAGAIYTATRKSHISTMDGLGRQMPFTFFAFFIASLSIIGLPPLAGSWVKWFLLLGALDADKLLVLLVVLGSSLLNIAYLLPIVVRGFFMPNPDGEAPLREAPLNCVIPLCLTALCCVLLFFNVEPLYELLGSITQALPHAAAEAETGAAIGVTTGAQP